MMYMPNTHVRRDRFDASMTVLVLSEKYFRQPRHQKGIGFRFLTRDVLMHPQRGQARSPSGHRFCSNQRSAAASSGNIAVRAKMLIPFRLSRPGACCVIASAVGECVIAGNLRVRSRQRTHQAARRIVRAGVDADGMFKVFMFICFCLRLRLGSGNYSSGNYRKVARLPDHFIRLGLTLRRTHRATIQLDRLTVFGSSWS